MEKITIPKQFTKPVRDESVTCWISKEISEKLDKISNETGISKQRIADLLLLADKRYYPLCLGNSPLSAVIRKQKL